jgi:hypothetical protein
VKEEKHGPLGPRLLELPLASSLILRVQYNIVVCETEGEHSLYPSGLCAPGASLRAAADRLQCWQLKNLFFRMNFLLVMKPLKKR